MLFNELHINSGVEILKNKSKTTVKCELLFINFIEHIYNDLDISIIFEFFGRHHLNSRPIFTVVTF